MADVTPTTEKLYEGCHRVTWAAVSTANTGLPASIGSTGSLTGFFQVDDTGGAFGGATVKLQGRNHTSANWVDLIDLQGDTVSFTANGGTDVSTGAAFIRPLVTGGTGDSLNVYFVYSK